MAYTETSKLGLKKAVPNSNQPFQTTVFNENLDAIDAEFVAVDGRLDAVEANNWVTQARIADNAIGSAELQPNSVVAGKVAPNAIGALELQPNSVGAEELQSNSVVAGKIAPNAISSLELQPNSVGSSEIQPGAVGDSQLAGGLNASKLAFGTLNPSLIPDDSLGASKLVYFLDLTSKVVAVPTQDVFDYSGLAASTKFAWDVSGLAVANGFSSRNTPSKFASGSVTATPSSGLITVDLTSFGFTSVPQVTANIFGATTAKLIVTVNAVSATQVQFKIWTSTFANSTTSTRVDWIAVAY